MLKVSNDSSRMNEISNHAVAIHGATKVQSFECCLAFDDDWVLTHVSDNVYDFIGREPQCLLGKQIHMLFSHNCIHDLRSSLNASLHLGYPQRIFNLVICDESETRWDISIHKNESIIIELERAYPRNVDHMFLSLHTMVGRLPQNGSVIDLLNVAANKIRTVTSYDRVMAYCVLADASAAGKIVAESKSPQVKSCLGLQFSASAVSNQAKIEMQPPPLSIIADINDLGVAIITNNSSPKTLDLTFSTGKAVAQHDAVFLTSMGMQASLTIAIFIEGKLWGRFVCHHRKPLYIALHKRTLLEFFTEILSISLTNALMREKDE